MDGFARIQDGSCLPIADDSGSTMVDSVDTWGETADTGPVGTGTRSIFVPGDFAGRDVVAISIDTMTFWAPRYMPNLSAILAESVYLTQHQCSAVWTPPCMDSFALGTPATMIGADVFQPDTTAGNAIIDDVYATFAETMVADGYTTGLVTGNGFFGSVSNTDQGYATLQDEKTLTEGVDKFVAMVADMQAEGGAWYAHYHIMGPHDPYIDEDEPSSYYACLNDIEGVPVGFDWADSMITFTIHDNWTSWTGAEQAAVREGLDCVYQGQLRWIDDMVFAPSGLWGDLEGQGAFANALVVLFSDHGEEFGERAEYGSPEFGHNRTTYAQVGQVLGAFWAPDIESSVVTVPTDHGDLAPSILSALGLEVPEAFGGTPIGEIEDDRILTRYRCSGDIGDPATEGYAARTAETSLHLRETGAWEQYDLVVDPDEFMHSGASDSGLQAVIMDLQARASEERWCGN